MRDNSLGGGMLHHEDLVVGRPYVFPARQLTREEIACFADAYEPRPESQGAAADPVAAPLHSCVLMMRALCDGLLNGTASLGSPGIDAVRWLRPVRPGEALRTRYTVQEKRDLVSRPDVGISKVLVELLDGQGEPATTWITNQLLRRRRPGTAPAAERQRARPELASLWDDAAPALPPTFDVFFEDSTIGASTDFGSHTFAEPEIIAFARRFDPQPFHVDPASAKASLFGALCASGWHTAAVFTRKLAAARRASNAAARARGIRLPAVGPTLAWIDLRWPRPVYVADRIDAAERPDRGLVAQTVQGRNQRREIVFACTALLLLERREPIARA